MKQSTPGFRSHNILLTNILRHQGNGTMIWELMVRSAFRNFAYPFLPVGSMKIWHVGSAAIALAAVAVFGMTFMIERFGTTPACLLSGIMLLCGTLAMHARFLVVARLQSRQATELVWNKETEFQSIFENALDAILVLDDQGVCQNANPSAGIFFSAACERIIGLPVRSFYAATGDFDSMWGQLKTDRRHQGEAELVRADGATVFAEFTAVASFLPNRHLMILRDVTRRRQAQQALTQSLIVARSSWQEAETLRKASVALTEDLRMNSVLDALLQTLADFVPYEQAQLFLLETDTEFFLAHEATRGATPVLEQGFPETFNLSDIPIVQRVLESSRGILLEDVSKDMSWRPAGMESSARSWIGVPIVASNVVLGLISLTDSRPGQFSLDHLTLTRSLATPAAVAIQNARLYERAEIYGAELERRVAELRQIDQGLQEVDNGNRNSMERFERIFRSAPVAISVSSLHDGKFLEINKAFEKRVGIRREEIVSGMVTEFELWEDLRERASLIERLGRGARVRSAVARFRQNAGSYKEMMYSAEMIHLDGQPCLLIATEDHVESNLTN